MGTTSLSQKVLIGAVATFGSDTQFVYGQIYFDNNTGKLKGSASQYFLNSHATSPTH